MRKITLFLLVLSILFTLVSCDFFIELPEDWETTESSAEEITIPDTSAPETTEPETTEPETTEPETTEPKTTEPGITEPEITEPETTEPETTEPETTEPPVIVPEGYVSKITITSIMNVLNIGQTIQLYTTIEPSNALVKSVTWSIIKGSECVKLSEQAKVTAIKGGTVVIRATSNDAYGTYGEITLEVKQTYVSSIKLSAEKTNISIGDSLQIKAQVQPTAAHDPSITYSIAEGGQYATITSDGLLQSKAVGRVVVQAKANDGSGVIGTITVDIHPVLVSSVTISAKSTELMIGETTQLTALCLPKNASNQSVTWSIEQGTSYASITSGGLLSALAPGKVVIKATANDASATSSTITITVLPTPVSGIRLTAPVSAVAAGGTVQISASVTPNNASDKSLVWSIVEGKGLATLSIDGLLTALDEGTVTVQAAAADGSGVKATLSLTITPAKVKTITISSVVTRMNVGQKVRLIATVKPDIVKNKTVTWSISNGSNLATIDDNGYLTALALGNVTVKATATDGTGITGTYSINIVPISVYSIKIEGSSDTLYVGRSMQLSAKVLPENASDKTVTWIVSSGDDVISVSSSGLVSGLKPGEATVMVKSNDNSGIYDSLKISVQDAPLFEKGKGTETNPYLISSADELNNIRRVVDQGKVYFKQTCDIDLSSFVNWTPIGSYDKPFKGIYDGAGYTITGMNIVSSNYYCGLFSTLDGAALRNIHLSSSTVSSDGISCGLLFGYAKESQIRFCNVSGIVESTNKNVGGLGGEIVGGQVYNCFFDGSVKGLESVGGLLGLVGNTTSTSHPHTVITLSSSKGTVSASTEIGGLIGLAHDVSLKQCASSSSVTSTGTGLMKGYAGGLVGTITGGDKTKCVVAECCATGNVSCEGTGYGCGFAGGLIGYTEAYLSIHDCYATGKVSIKGEDSKEKDLPTYHGGIYLKYRNPAGSLIGCMNVLDTISLYNCYATGKVSSEIDRCTDGRVNCAGALVGLIYDTVSYNRIRSEYKAPYTNDRAVEAYYIDITADMLATSVIDRLENNFTIGKEVETFTSMNYFVNIDNSYRLLGTMYRSMPTYRVTTNIAPENMTNQNIFNQWDFASIWTMGENGPILKAIQP